MSAALKTRLVECTSRISALNFDEHDIRSLYQLLREAADPKGYTKEIANFFAHPEWDRGIIHKAIKPIITAFNNAGDGKAREISISPIRHIDILNDLNAELLRHGIPEIREEGFESVALIILVALQSCSVDLTENSKASIHLFVFDDKEIALCAFTPKFLDSNGAIFPIISMPNTLGLPQFMMQPEREGNPILVASYKQGELHIAQVAEPIIVEFPRKTP